eukprot:TRINITY_DN16807_c0_g1_i2.p1 TRINITY_DN16807_c0_g1~~TRINITY_DN16807_c0_g1_i2.p1  ORF type:complete len:424 (+),score=50.33 TRINITY_DN16807_c0_g1_i2:103-1374(+)
MAVQKEANECTPVLREGRAPHLQESDISTLFILLKNIMGAGGFAFPLAFVHSGIVGGLILSLVISVFAMFTIRELEQLGHHVRAVTGKTNISYADVVHASLGVVAVFFVNVFTVIGGMGACAAYLAYISETISLLFPILSRQSVVFLTAAALLLVVLSDDFSIIARLAFAGTMAVLIGYIATALYAYTDMDLLAKPVVFGTWIGILKAIGPICFLLCTHTSIYVIQNQSQSLHTPGRFSQIAAMAIAMSVLATASFGCLGPLYFGPGVSSIVLNDIPSNSTVLLSLKLLMCAALIGTYPLIFAVLRIPVCEILSCCTAELADQPIPGCQWRQEAFFRGALVALTAMGACVGDFGDIVALSGGIASTSLAFVIPPIMALSLLRSEMSPGRFCANVLMIPIAVMVSGAASAVTVACIFGISLPAS